MKYLCVLTPPSFKGAILEFPRRIGVLRRKLELPLTVFYNASVSQNCIKYWAKKKYLFWIPYKTNIFVYGTLLRFYPIS